jgi:hypothetical protein
MYTVQSKHTIAFHVVFHPLTQGDPTRPLGAFINEQNMLPRLYTFCGNSLAEGGLLLCGGREGVRDFHAVSLLCCSLSLATPTQRRHLASRRLARAYFCGLFSHCCCIGFFFYFFIL